MFQNNVIMYRWKPSKSQKRQFAEKMQDPEFAKAYYRRKEERADKQRATSNYDYSSAGGYYVPTSEQNKVAFIVLSREHDTILVEAANMVTFGYSTNTKIHHDYIHVINEYRRNNNI